MVGAGNVASHLAPALSLSGAGKIVQVYSRHLDSADSLAGKIAGATATDSFEEIINGADVYIISVADDAIGSVADRLPKGDALYLHTSGSVGMDVLSGLSPRHGVFYPLQTFSRGVELDMRSVPLFIEGSTPAVESDIRAFASGLFERVYHADSDTRKKMHISAVFACNFTNYLWSIAEDILSKNNLPFDVMRPLLEETLRKALVNGPEKSQTGPAVRGDRRVIDGHHAMLDGREREIYRLLSDGIMDLHGVR
ncbi:MAG: F420-dependent NADP oxidoreductase [Bacteroides sp.]|nr:F420-dependent NADP oxidoreductase [Bacteroides sp.]